MTEKAPVNPPLGNNCANCVFYVTRVIGDLTVGECHHSPPQTSGIGSGHGYWPQVEPEDWCGQWGAR